MTKKRFQDGRMDHGRFLKKQKFKKMVKHENFGSKKIFDPFFGPLKGPLGAFFGLFQKSPKNIKNRKFSYLTSKL